MLGRAPAISTRHFLVLLPGYGSPDFPALTSELPALKVAEGRVIGVDVRVVGAEEGGAQPDLLVPGSLCKLGGVNDGSGQK